MTVRTLGFVGCGVLLLACGGISSSPTGNPGGGGAGASEGGEAPQPTTLLIRGDGCPTFVDPAEAYTLFSMAHKADGGAVIGVARVRVVEECSGAGGTHVFSTLTQEGKRFWLGAHACWLQGPEEIDFGVIVGLGQQTAGVFRGNDGWCMRYPGESEAFATDVSTTAMAWFPSEAEAHRFVEAL